MTNIFGAAAENFLGGRGISGEVGARFEIYTASKNPAGVLVPDPDGKIIVYPFLEHDHVVNEKFRLPPKTFWQTPGGRRTFWNSDALDDPGLHSGHMALVITEGIEDALAAIESGYPLTVSVPDGAPTPGSKVDDDKLDPKAERSGKFEFLWNNRDRLKAIKRFIIATDNDTAGKLLAEELVRRLSAARCSFIEFPVACKDLNDVLVRHGSVGIAAVLNAAKPYPVRGLYRLSEYPEAPDLVTFSPGFDDRFDRDVDGANAYLRLFHGEFIIVTGIPGHGKSSWVMALIVNLAQRYGWRTAVFSPEMPTMPHLRDKLRRLILNRKAVARDLAELVRADEWINDTVLFIDHDPAGDLETELSLDWVLDRATDAVLRDGIRVLVIDPWNEVEHAKKRDETMTEYIGRSIRALRRWAQQHGVIVIVVAHPTKEVGREGKSRVPSLYDIDGAAHWFNKPDHGIVVSTVDDVLNVTTIYIRKVRFDQTGRKGKHRFKYDPDSGRYLALDGTF
jgi:twinkle protein